MEEEKMLKLGEMTGQQLAEWFGISYKTYTNSRKKKLEILTSFADFEEVKQGVIKITAIKIPVYSKKSDRIKDIIRENFFSVWHESLYDTSARAASQLYRNNTELKKICKNEATFKHYFNEVRREMFGRVAISEEGTKGTCHYEYVESNNWEEAILLSEDKKAILKQITQKWYVNEQEPLLYDALQKKEISQQDFDEAMAEWNSPEARSLRYGNWLNEVIMTLNKIDKVTKLEPCAWNLD